MSETNYVDCLVMRWRCGWCGTPTQEDGTPMAISEIGLTKDIEKHWGDAKLVNGDCCLDNDLYLGHASIAEELDT